MKKFLKYQLKLEGTSEKDLTGELVNTLNSDFENKTGIYNQMFNYPEVVSTIEDDTIALQGIIIAETAKECKAIYTLLKAESKKVFKNCSKTTDLLVATGDKLY